MSYLSPYQIFFILTVHKIAAALVTTLTAVTYIVLLERKVSDRIQNCFSPILQDVQRHQQHEVTDHLAVK